MYSIILLHITVFGCAGKGLMYFLPYHTTTNMTTKSNKRNEALREVRQIIGRTQGEFAAMIGASKDAVASWEIGRNRLAPQFARRIALATGVEEEGLRRGRGPLRSNGGEWSRKTRRCAGSCALETTRGRATRRPCAWKRKPCRSGDRDFPCGRPEAAVRGEQGKAAVITKLDSKLGGVKL
jgi:transcriptional regulator with XRE-family HTH domain